ncbi:MAG: thioredoxin [Clostridia bacterium]|nr:thioredoxin [Clostridia bacterium]
MIIRICLLLAAVAVLIYGLTSGGTADVLAKAKAICTECVGLG